jgi:hypothetical protein
VISPGTLTNALAIAVSPLQRASCAAVDVDHAALDEILFNSEIFSDSKLTLVHGTDPNLTRPGLAVVDNIDPWKDNCHGNTVAWGDGNGNGPNLDGLFAAHG